MPGRRLLLLSLCILFLVSFADAQIFPTPTPTPRPGSRQANLPPTVADNEHYERLRKIEMLGQSDTAKDHPLLDPKKGIYRKPSKEETAVLSVSDAHLHRYAGFLRGQNTGIFKLNGISACVTDADIIIATEECIGYKMPGAGTAYSFRTNSYRLPRLADVILVDGTFMTGGVFQQVIMTDLGNVELDSVTTATDAVKHLADIRYARDDADFMRFNDELIRGFEIGGIRFGKRLPVNKDSVYVLRSIAYRGQFLRSIEGIQYNELDFDKRRDAIIAMKVIDIDDAGHVTVAWRRLKDVEAPKLKVAK